MNRDQVIAARVSEKTVLQQTQTSVDNLLEDLNLNGCIIDSRDVDDKVKKCMKSFSGEIINENGKIKIANFLCNKMSDIFRLSFEKKNIIVTDLTEIIYRCEDMILPLRLSYLHFKNETVPYSISCNLFNNGIRDRLDTIPYFQILKYILRSYLATPQIKQQILEEFEELFASDLVSIYIKMEIADIFILTGKPIRGYEMINTIRQLEIQLDIDIDRNQNDGDQYQRVTTVYSDSQNVHSSDINTSVLNACIQLIIKEQTPDFIPEEVTAKLSSIAPQHKTAIETVVQRVEIDTSRFTVKKDTFSLHNLFSSLWNYIITSPHKDELFNRLIEEMVAMSKYCTTGHLSRFINVIQGYTDDEKLWVTITDQTQIKSVVSSYLDKKLMEADDKISEAMIEDNKEPFYTFIVNVVNDRMVSFLRDYGDVQKHIVTAVQEYSQWDYWKIKNNILIVKLTPPPQKRRKPTRKSRKPR